MEVEATWGVYQRIIAAYREPTASRDEQMNGDLIESVSKGIPKTLSEVITLGRTLKKRAADVLAYFDRPHTSNGPTEAINGRLEHLRGPPSASATSPTTSPAACSRPAGSDPDYTLDSEEPVSQDIERFLAALATLCPPRGCATPAAITKRRAGDAPEGPPPSPSQVAGTDADSVH